MNLVKISEAIDDHVTKAAVEVRLVKEAFGQVPPDNEAASTFDQNEGRANDRCVCAENLNPDVVVMKPAKYPV